MSKRRSPEQWRSILSAFHRSGQSQSAFCSERGLSLSSLQYQLRRERSRAEAATDGPTSSSSPRLVEVTPGGGRDGRPGEPDRALRVACSLDSRRVTIECPPGQLAQLLAGLSTFHHQHGTGR